MPRVDVNDENLTDVDSAHAKWVVAREQVRDLQLQLQQAERELYKAQCELTHNIHILMDYLT